MLHELCIYFMGGGRNDRGRSRLCVDLWTLMTYLGRCQDFLIFYSNGISSLTFIMFGLLAIAGIPTVTGVASGVSSKHEDQSSRSEEQRMRKFNLQCYCTPNTPSARRLNTGRVILRDSKLYIVPRNEKINGHPFEGFYLAYPDPDRRLPRPMGLVSTTSNELPMLNWIYVDKKTRELKYGNRTQSKEHFVGSWDWDTGEESGPGGLVLEGDEAAIAICTSEGTWELRWEDANAVVCVAKKEVVRVSLERKMLEPTEEDKTTESNEMRTLKDTEFANSEALVKK